MGSGQKRKFTYETLGKTIKFAQYMGFKPELKEWSTCDISILEAEAIEFIETNGYRIDLSARQTKVKSMAQALVASQWKEGVPARSWTGNFKTDGLLLYSYDKAIGTTDRNGNKIVFNYTKAGNAFISPSTGKHVGFGKQVTDIVRDPTEGTIELDTQAKAAK
jgi:hypothetical protein